MADRYFVRIIENAHRFDEDGTREVGPFPKFWMAKEFCRRWLRDSLEELRTANQAPEQLKHLWFLYGDDAHVIGAEYYASHELDFFLAHPATIEERDWSEIKAHLSKNGHDD
ncbi:MAG: hypothetical protein K1Y36_28120 [Blastocatellia bacterium]|nr:hypothetical protein [Blastocatellia bacterium]